MPHLLTLAGWSGTGGRRRTRLDDPKIAVALFELHPEVEIFALQQLRDLLERLLTDVLDLEQVVLAELDQIPQGADVRVLERVERPHRETEVVDRTAQPLPEVPGHASRRGRAAIPAGGHLA